MGVLVGCIGVTSYMMAFPSPSPDYEQCVQFKNVKATLQRGGSGTVYVEFESTNDGPTKVSWCVNGTKDGYPMSIASGDIVVNRYAKTEPFSVKGCDRVWVKIFNCDRENIY